MMILGFFLQDAAVLTHGRVILGAVVAQRLTEVDCNDITIE